MLAGMPMTYLYTWHKQLVVMSSRERKHLRCVHYNAGWTAHALYLHFLLDDSLLANETNQIIFLSQLADINIALLCNVKFTQMKSANVSSL